MVEVATGLAREMACGGIAREVARTAIVPASSAQTRPK